MTCRDGDPICDSDGAADGACTFGVGVCVLGEGVEGCTATAVESIKPSRVLLAPGKLVTQALALPTLPASETACSTSAALVRLPLRGRSRTKASRRLKLRLKATATVGGASAKDKDKLTLQCLPHAGEGECPANAAGGPRELRLVAADTGTDLDNGWTGVAHNFRSSAARRSGRASPAATRARTPPAPSRARRGAGRSTALGPPLPLFVLGAATCLVLEYDGPITGTADLATGETDVTLGLAAEVWIAPPGIVCPQCSGNARGDTGVCLDGPDKGRACRVEGTIPVSDAGETFELSSSCRPDGTLAARLRIPLQVTTSDRALDGPLPCDGQLETNGCPGGGGCSAACTGDACVAQVPDPVDPSISRCVDRKGGLAQQCCDADTTLACFAADRTERVGKAVVPTPAWPDPVYPKTAEPVLVDVFCEPATGQNLFDAVTTGLPGASALVLPMHACYRDDETCP